MHLRAGQKALPEDLIDVDAVLDAYYDLHPDPADPEQAVSFGTSGHRGSSLDAKFTEDHIAATTQAIVEYRAGQGISGPLFMGRDTHALSRPAFDTALEVLAGNEVDVRIDAGDSFTPTPAISHAILVHNRALAPNASGRADGIVVSPATTRRGTAASSTTPRTAARPTRTRPAGSPTVRTSCWPAVCAVCAVMAGRRRCRRPGATTTSTPMSRT